jgi:hypothetical protein
MTMWRKRKALEIANGKSPARWNRDHRTSPWIADNEARFAPAVETADLAGIRERLAALYGDGARIALRRCLH